jgi:hypothetical protein
LKIRASLLERHCGVGEMNHIHPPNQVERHDSSYATHILKLAIGIKKQAGWDTGVTKVWNSIDG